MTNSEPDSDEMLVKYHKPLCMVIKEFVNEFEKFNDACEGKRHAKHLPYGCDDIEWRLEDNTTASVEVVYFHGIFCHHAYRFDICFYLKNRLIFRISVGVKNKVQNINLKRSGFSDKMIVALKAIILFIADNNMCSIQDSECTVCTVEIKNDNFDGFLNKINSIMLAILEFFLKKDLLPNERD